jgi:hypothetical protein
MSLRGGKARGRRTTSTATFTGTTTGVLRIDNVPLKAGRLYRVEVDTLTVRGSIALDGILSMVRFSTTGAATTTSTILAGAQNYCRVPAAASGFTVRIGTRVEPAADATYSFLLTAIRSAGAGNVDIYCDTDAVLELSVEDIGLAVGNTGVVI